MYLFNECVWGPPMLFFSGPIFAPLHGGNGRFGGHFRRLAPGTILSLNGRGRIRFKGIFPFRRKMGRRRPSEV